jgi:hypothetical protein
MAGGVVTIWPIAPKRKRDGLSVSQMNLTRVILGILALFATSPLRAAPPQEQRPYSCRLRDDAQRKCAFGQCDQRETDRLRKECWRDGRRP